MDLFRYNEKNTTIEWRSEDGRGLGVVSSPSRIPRGTSHDRVRLGLRNELGNLNCRRRPFREEVVEVTT
jgi:hypothetical protein